MEYDSESSRVRATSFTALRSVLVPLAGFYARAAVPDDASAAGEASTKPDAKLTSQERGTLTQAAYKLALEAEHLMRSLRVQGDVAIPPLKRDERGRFPEPSLALVGEVLALSGMVETPKASRSKEELEIARLEAELERERLALERQRLAIIEHQVTAGAKVVHDPGPVMMRSRPLSVAPPPTVVDPPAMSRAGKVDGTPQMQTLKVVQMPKAEPPVAPEAREASVVGGEVGIWEGVSSCLRVALCDLILCFLDLVCVDGRFNWNAFDDDEVTEQLLDCFGVFLCTALRCFVDVLCPPEQPRCLPSHDPCDIAVEEY